MFINIMACFCEIRDVNMSAFVTFEKILKTNIMDKLTTDEMQVIKGGGVWVEIMVNGFGLLV